MPFRFLSGLHSFIIALLFLSKVFFVYSQEDPPSVIAIGDQIYCPQTQQNIVTEFDINDTDNSSASGFYIQISSGYIIGEDQLILIGDHPNIVSNWNSSEAKLSLLPADGISINYIDIIEAVLNVVFFSSNIDPLPKTFSLTIGEANFLNGHYYEFVASEAITWTAAKIIAETMNYYGLQGYLATITNSEEAQICGELTPGTGWIGGSDAQTEGVWKWVTGPEQGEVFWNGNDTGSSPPGIYSNWNTGEPNNSGDEDYAHITDQSVGLPGSWNDLPNTTTGQGVYQSTGFLVEYGGMPNDPELNISANAYFNPPEILSTSTVSGCENEIITLEATSNTTNIIWFDSQFGGNQLNTGNIYSVELSTDMTFWVLASENNCSNGLRVPINAIITPNEPSEFTQIDDVCEGTQLNLPTTSNNGITGTWSPAFDPNNTTTYFFEPENNQCASTAEMTITIEALISPEFTQIDDICEGTEIWTGGSPFSVTSNNGIIGVWSPAFDAYNTTTYSFTPDNGQCASSTEMTIVIIPLTNPDFTQIDDICQGTELSMPTSSNEGVTGTWNPEFDPYNTTTYTFEPDEGQCFSMTEMTIVVIPSSIPTFNQIDPICIGSNNSELPLISNNGFEGTWFPNLIDNTQTTTYIFTPNDENCVENVSMTIIVNELTNPNFDIDDICIGENIGALPTISNEGISGVWSPLPNNLATTTYTFSPDVGQCANTTTRTIEVSSFNNLEITVENLSEGFDPNQIIQLSVTGGSGNYEYQLDGGLWQNSSIFQNVIGCYEHVVKVKDVEGCSNEPESTIIILDYPKFFTPNGDGFNDFWNIKCLENQTAIVSIFNRHGKLLRQLKTSSPGWNGLYNGNILAADDYWFAVTYYDENGNKKEFRSHFSLKR